MSFNGLGAEGVCAVSHVVRADPALRALDISGNACGDESFVTLIDALAAIGLPLVTLDASANHLGHKGGMRLAELLRANATLTNVDVRDNDLGVEVGTALLLVKLGHAADHGHGGADAASCSPPSPLVRLDGLEFSDLMGSTASTLNLLSLIHI